MTRNLPPLVGGMERLNWHMAAELAVEADVRVIGPVGSAALAPSGVTVVEVPLVPLWKFLLRAWQMARGEARRWKPDVVLAGSGLTAPIARAAAIASGARAYAYVHGLDVAVGHPVYRAIWLHALRRMNGTIANSGPTAILCRDIGIAPEKIGIVHPGVDLPSQPFLVQSKMEAAGFRDRHCVGNGPLLLSVGRLSTRKGVREFVSDALPRIAAVHPEVQLLIVGDAPAQALHAQTQTRESIQAAADASGVGANICFLGKISDAELHVAYSACDLHVFPVREIPGDPEGFGMVAVEAAAYGLPTVAFAAGGVIDAVSEGYSGHLVPCGDYVALSNAVIATLAERESLRPRCMEFASRFEWLEFGVQLRRMMSAPNMHYLP